jgi:predicted LPLAT superfamily acyltransferase
MELEVHKTQATLSGGSVLGIVAVTELMVTSPVEWRWMLFLGVIALLYSSTYAIATMLSLSTTVMTLLSPGVNDQKQRRKLTWFRGLSMLAFPLGLGLSAFFLMLNLFF